MVRELGGPGDLIERPRDHLAAAPVVRAVVPARPGVVAAMEVRALGLAVMELGGGRRRAEDPVDHAVGLGGVAAIGEPVDNDRPLALVHARDEASAQRAADTVRAATTVADQAGPPGPVLGERISGPA
jgi:thymidine phosphorylase